MKVHVPEMFALKSKVATHSKAWKVLVVDDRLSVQKATCLLLGKMSYAGSGFETIESYSFKDSKKILKEGNDIALVILDVHLEGNDIGLQMMNYIRRDLQNDTVRVILRTGYPTLFPEEAITKEYHIDGCLFEEENTFSKLEFEIIGAIQTYRKILSINNYLEGFASGVAIEIKNSLNMFGLNFSTIKNELFEVRNIHRDENAEYFTELINKGVHICKRSDMIVDLMLRNIRKARIDDKCFKLIRMSSIVQQSIEDFAYSSAYENDKFELDFYQDFTFRGDENSFVYVLFNLFKNSLFYLVDKPEGKIQIRLELGTDQNALYFKDNGIGIPKDQVNNIFEGFRSQSEIENTGLGLAFCKQVMRDFGGDIICQSDYGYWTQFILTFPRCS